MAEEGATQLEREPEHASDSEARNRTQTREQQGTERQAKGLAAAQDDGRDRQLAQRHYARDGHLVKETEQAEQAVTQTQGRSDRGGAPAVRLDMDLDLDIHLRAKIHGDIELSILDSEQASQQRHSAQR
ncbi:hypothetical protein VTK56DRAFT_6691 [Thermocarpiscus australiensis]